MDGFFFNLGMKWELSWNGSNFKRKLKINKFSYIKNINDLPMTKKHLKQSQKKGQTEENIC